MGRPKPFLPSWVKSSKRLGTGASIALASNILRADRVHSIEQCVTNSNAKLGEVLDWCEMAFLPGLHEESSWNAFFYYILVNLACVYSQ